MPMRRSARKTLAAPQRVVEFPPRLSSGYLVRDAHRAFQRLLERRIAAYGVISCACCGPWTGCRSANCRRGSA